MTQAEEFSFPQSRWSLASVIAKAERERLLRVQKMEARKPIAIVGFVLTLACSAGLTWNFYPLYNSNSLVIMILGFGLALLFGLWWQAPRDQFLEYYKTEIFPEIARSFDFSYDPDGGFNMQEIMPSRIVPTHDTYAQADYFHGTYKGVEIAFCSAVLKRRKRHNYYQDSANDGPSQKRKMNSGSNQPDAVFRGLIMKFKVTRKKFNSHTILLHNYDRMFRIPNKEGLGDVQGMERINLVDPRFEGVFDVYGTDQTDARYLVDPAMMEKIMELYERNIPEPIKNIVINDQSSSPLSGLVTGLLSNAVATRAALYDQTFLLMIPGDLKRYAPPPFHDVITEGHCVDAFKKDLEGILRIVDILDLDRL